MTDVEDILVAALRLPADARAALAAELIDSLDDPPQPDEDVDAAWSEEIRQRLADVDAGVVTPIAWPEARRHIPEGQDKYPRGGDSPCQTQAGLLKKR